MLSSHGKAKNTHRVNKTTADPGAKNGNLSFKLSSPCGLHFHFPDVGRRDIAPGVMFPEREGGHIQRVRGLEDNTVGGKI